MVGGAIALTYNVEGVDNLVLTPDVTAKIFNNQITNWNDPALAAVNPGVSLPDAPIAQFHRSDGSGTTGELHPVDVGHRPGCLAVPARLGLDREGRSGSRDPTVSPPR